MISFTGTRSAISEKIPISLPAKHLHQPIAKARMSTFRRYPVMSELPEAEAPFRIHKKTDGHFSPYIIIIIPPLIQAILPLLCTPLQVPTEHTRTAQNAIHRPDTPVISFAGTSLLKVPADILRHQHIRKNSSRADCLQMKVSAVSARLHKTQAISAQKSFPPLVHSTLSENAEHKWCQIYHLPVQLPVGNSLFSANLMNRTPFSSNGSSAPLLHKAVISAAELSEPLLLCCPSVLSL